MSRNNSNFQSKPLVMENNKDPFVEKWKKTREKGFTKHFYSTGLSFGILLFVVLTAYDYFFVDKKFESTYDFIIQLVICIVFGGGIYAIFIWFLNEMMYKKKSQNKN